MAFFVLYIYLSPFHQIEPLGGGRIGPQDDVLGPRLHLDPVGGCPPHDQDVLRGDVQLDGVHSTEEDPEATASGSSGSLFALRSFAQNGSYY